ncbi:hypothetical protein Msil_0608 [Methylocella silvestris BL2]|uniref:Uncharacterized protein n=1 Tax=Methylocella silvestris (strain DSM 15510 / CIP 108128 / LMG 27833 / NCIMB 13906 / BL2) TaxID=395965 RepID=B8EN67_METSB|nr:hypothetical protein [Methylocella silvestris]ACK49580.1 hypothetical protein Msil_0608 [Methylocella silvestris BL2]
MNKAELLEQLSAAIDAIARSEELVANQRQIVDLFERQRQDAIQAKEMLEQFEEILASQMANRDRLLKELSEISG